MLSLKKVGIFCFTRSSKSSIFASVFRCTLRPLLEPRSTIRLKTQDSRLNNMPSSSSTPFPLGSQVPNNLLHVNLPLEPPPATLYLVHHPSLFIQASTVAIQDEESDTLPFPSSTHISHVSRHSIRAAPYTVPQDSYQHVKTFRPERHGTRVERYVSR